MPLASSAQAEAFCRAPKGRFTHPFGRLLLCVLLPPPHGRVLAFQLEEKKREKEGKKKADTILTRGAPSSLYVHAYTTPTPPRTHTDGDGKKKSRSFNNRKSKIVRKTDNVSVRLRHNFYTKIIN